jgi:hypothetical protein
MKKKILAIVSALVLVFGLGFFAKTENVYAANDTNKAQVEEKIKELKAAVRKNEIQAAAAKLLMEKNPKAVESFRGELEELLRESENLVQRAKLVIAALSNVKEDGRVETTDVSDKRTEFKGTIKIFTTDEIINYQNLEPQIDSYLRSIDIYKNRKWAVLVFDKEREINAVMGAGEGRRDGLASMVYLGQDNPEYPKEMEYFDYAKKYEGKRVKIKVESLIWPSEVSIPYSQPRIYSGELNIIEE